MKFLNLIPVLAAIGPLLGVIASPITEGAISSRDNDLSAELSEIGKRDLSSKFKLHIVNAGGRVLQIIIIDYIINNLPGQDTVTATLDSLSTSPLEGSEKTIEASFFEATAYRSAEVVFSFATKAISGAFEFNVDGTGLATSLVNAGGVQLGAGIVAKYLRFFNEKNTLLATQTLS
jgi:hypothetical protein